jgi:hypothetical protein
LLAGNITSGGGDGVDTAGGSGGLSYQTASTTIAQANLPNVNFVTSVTIAAGQGSHNHILNAFQYVIGAAGPYAPNTGAIFGSTAASVTSTTTLPAMTGTGTAASGGSNTPAVSATFADMPPFSLVTYYMKL